VTTEVKLPQYGMGMSEGTVTAWLKVEGERVEKGDPLVEVEAAKANVEVPAPEAGVLAQILTQVGETVPIHHVLAIIDDGAAGAITASPGPAPAKAASRSQIRPVAAAEAPGRVSPRLRRLAAQHGVDLAQVAGSGPNGRIEEADVLRAAAKDV
jgi:pyruvate/2-oxoglutarate dehydrogenase complex dihydrolipoamide acyltransferase (E2) component